MFSESVAKSAQEWEGFFEELKFSEWTPPEQWDNESDEDYAARVAADAHIEKLRKMVASNEGIRGALGTAMLEMMSTGIYINSTIVKQSHLNKPSDWLREIQEFIGVDSKWSPYITSQFNNAILNLIPALEKHGFKIGAEVLAQMLSETGQATVGRVIRDALAVLSIQKKNGGLDKEAAEIIAGAIKGDKDSKMELEGLAEVGKLASGEKEKGKIVAQVAVGLEEDVWTIKVPKEQADAVERILNKYFDVKAW